MRLCPASLHCWLWWVMVVPKSFAASPLALAAALSSRFSHDFLQPAETAAAASHAAVADGPAAGAQHTTSTHFARGKATAGCHLLDVHGVTGYVCPHGVPVCSGMVVQKEPECYARYRQGLALVAEERTDLQAFISELACQMEQSMKGHMPELLGGTSFRAGQMHGSTHMTPCHSCSIIWPWQRDLATSLASRQSSSERL